MDVVLIGARGSGKSTVGHAMASQLGCEFVDLDDRVLARFEQDSVRDVWAICGEPAWREAEVHTLRETLAADERTHERQTDDPRRVISLGGGVPLIAEARAMLQHAASENRAISVYLQTSVETMRQRLSRNPGDRPSLRGDDPSEDVVDEIASIMAEREPAYRSLARLIVTTDDQTAEQVATEIIRQLGTKP